MNDVPDHQSSLTAALRFTLNCNPSPTMRQKTLSIHRSQAGTWATRPNLVPLPKKKVRETGFPPNGHQGGPERLVHHGLLYISCRVLGDHVPPVLHSTDDNHSKSSAQQYSTSDKLLQTPPSRDTDKPASVTSEYQPAPLSERSIPGSHRRPPFSRMFSHAATTI